MNKIEIKRIYDENDGNFRVLVDRLWPRGISKEKANINMWNKSITPSNNLRKSFHNNEITLEEFSILYKKELIQNPEFILFKNLILEKLKSENITFLTSAKITLKNHPYILRDLILDNDLAL